MARRVRASWRKSAPRTRWCGARLRISLLGEETPLTSAAASAVVSAASSPAELGTLVGPYRLESELGRGGMGTVYLARRADGQYDARVAIKLVRADLDGKPAAARFRLERQYLAVLEHPFIARLLDGGVTEDGRLFLVLEYIDGTPIDAYCATHALRLKDWLRLLRSVCAAVEYAHQHLIVHRDLKPSNVLVCADGTPKLVDFGIATLLHPEREAANTLDVGRFLTPGYASPEQRSGGPVTTASDVYSLGVLLHELLTGCLPRATSAPDEDADPLPVSRAAALEAMKAGPAGRAVDSRELRGDVDAIVAKALRSVATERYSTAAALDEDLRRVIEGEPVRARRSTLAYRGRKFVRRHALGVGMTGALGLSLVSSGVLYSIEARTTAQARTVAARRGEFLEKVLKSANPAGGRRDVTVAEVLDASAAQLAREQGEDPVVAASLFGVLAETNEKLGRYPQAIDASDHALALLRAHGGNPGSIADALMSLGDSQRHVGALGAAEASLREAISVLGSASRTSAARAQAHDLLGIALKQGGREKEAEAAYRTAIALYAAVGGDAGAKAAYPMDNLGVLLGEEGRYAESSALEARALAVALQHLPPEHPDVLDFELNQASALMGQNASARAEPLFRHVVEARTRLLGPQHKDTLMAVVQLVDCLEEQGRYAEAVAMGRPAAEGLERLLGFEHGVTLYGWNTYGSAACQTEHAADGLEVLRRVAAAREKLYGRGEWHAASTGVSIGTCLVTLGRFPEAEAALADSARSLEGARGASYHRTQAAYRALRDLCARLGRAGDADRWAARITPPPAP